MRLFRIITAICGLAANCLAAEKGKPFVPPPALVPEPTIEIVVDSLPVSASAACPMDASVIVDATEGSSHFTGSGTCVHSEGGKSTILTCAHIFRGLKNPDVRVQYQKKDYPATVVRCDDRNDVAALSIQGQLPAIDLSPVKPSVGDTVTSVGLGTEQTHNITLAAMYDNVDQFESDGTQQFGRSGGGVFLNGALCGIIKAKRNDEKASLYVGLRPIRRVLDTSVSGHQKLSVTLWKAPFHCSPCDRSERNLVGDDRFDLTVKTGPAPFMTPEWLERNKRNGYPYFEHNGKIYFGYTTADGLAELLGAEEGNAVSSGPVGATIEGRAVIEAALSSLESWFGDGAEFSFKWSRKGAADALLINKQATREELLGKSGRVEIVTTSNRLPIHKIAFDYRFDAGKVFFKLDEIECDIPEEGAVGSVQPVGVGGIMLAWTILSTIQFIHSVLSPTVDIWLGSEINATAKLSNKQLLIDCGPNPPSIRARWAFFFRLIRFEYSRPLTNVTLAVPESILGFHKSRTFRDVVVEVK